MEGIGAFLPLILIFGVFYILLIRPQQKKVKLHKEMLNNLKKGDKIITSGGIIGKISTVNDNRELNVEISNEVEIKIAPGMVADLYITQEKLKIISVTVETKLVNVLDKSIITVEESGEKEVPFTASKSAIKNTGNTGRTLMKFREFL